ncbi:MAG: hypothetical protein E6850_09040 [Leclercia adecarboxylata]|nr:hypothetical protein [Leclercia adecarboxylata]
MEKEIIKTAMQFMIRVNLSGQEVPAFNAVMNAMQAEVDRQESATQEMKDGTNE